jgi:hypothetical protein
VKTPEAVLQRAAGWNELPYQICIHGPAAT